VATFYVIYIGDEAISLHVDAIRLLANPTEKSRAHLTVRGPYARRYPNLDSVGKRFAGLPVAVEGLGNFFDHGQTTVFLKCEAEWLRTIWRKPDYEYNPHLTLFDGRDARFARKLYLTLREFEFDLTFHASALLPLTTRSKQSSLDLLTIDGPQIEKLLGLPASPQALAELSEPQRLGLIRRLAESLQNAALGWAADRPVQAG
jgi:hypothetical protein